MNKTCPGCGKPIDENAVLCDQCLKIVDILLRKKPYNRRTVILRRVTRFLFFCIIVDSFILLDVPFSTKSTIIMLAGIAALILREKV